MSEAYTPEAIEASARWMVFQPRAKAWREWPPGRDGPRCQAGDEGRKAWELQQQQQEKYAAASDSGGGPAAATTSATRADVGAARAWRVRGEARRRGGVQR